MKRYNCQGKNPCTDDDNIYNSLCLDPITMYFAHDDPGKYVQCSEWDQCWGQWCPGGLVYDVEIDGCTWP